MTRHLAKIIATLFLLIAGTAVLYAQGSVVRISGNVKNAKGEKLSYATVRLKDKSIGCITDNNGNFSFNGSVEQQTLIISSIGYEDFALPLSANTVFPLNVTLKEVTYEIDEVVIKPQKDNYSNKDNPAVELINEIIERKNSDNPFNNDYVSRERYETYVVALDNFTP